ncbi:hypothetical protein [Caulobacter sp. 602-1]|uniref:hypothetical protein n=1 Tax=Caulobacter sp. 602-1 TaxID=2492472 RepID=UPI000F63668D|nr:hypothetical protein [Caulobacter sp. 602-1]RRN62207.1 hypothetical protein EIK80_22765 [Caulobacter sp. 602-1]
MKRAIFLAGVALACLSLSACSSLDAALQPGGVGEKVLTNLEGCHREYSGALGAGVTGSFRIICDPVPSEVAPPAEPAAPPGGT